MCPHGLLLSPGPAAVGLAVCRCRKELQADQLHPGQPGVGGAGVRGAAGAGQPADSTSFAFF